MIWTTTVSLYWFALYGKYSLRNKCEFYVIKKEKKSCNFLFLLFLFSIRGFSLDLIFIYNVSIVSRIILKRLAERKKFFFSWSLFPLLHLNKSLFSLSLYLCAFFLWCLLFHSPKQLYYLFTAVYKVFIFLLNSTFTLFLEEIIFFCFVLCVFLTLLAHIYTFTHFNELYLLTTRCRLL